MDEEWAGQQLTEFIELTTLYTPPQPRNGVVVLGDRARPRGNNDEILKKAQVVEQILDRVNADWREGLDPKHRRWQGHRAAAIRARTELEQREVLRERLGDNAPSIRATEMHRWVWEGARSLWQSGHFSEAVRAAAIKVNAETQNKVNRRDISETDLFNQAFSDSPPADGNARLRLPNDDDGKTARSARRGIRSFADGCYASLRNPASHDPQKELPMHEAVEQLAAFSILARWVDASEVTEP